MTDQPPGGVLRAEGVRLGLAAADKWDAVRQSGALLVELGACDPGYADAMLEREHSVSTFIGEGVAIPHGTDTSRSLVRRTTLGRAAVPAGRGLGRQRGDGLRGHRLQRGRARRRPLGARADPDGADQAERLRSATDIDEVLALLAGVDQITHEEMSA